MYRMLICLFFLLLASTSWANCQQLITDLAKRLHPNVKLGPSEQSNCKKWPYSTDKTLVTMTLLSNSPNQIPDAPIYDLDVIIVNNNNGEIISHLYETEAFGDDAISTYSITFDTASYQLNPSIRAFGIRFHQKNYSRYNNYAGEVLNLYYLQDKTLRLVLRGLNVYEFYGQWEEDCTGEFKDIKRTLAIEEPQKNGFSNLKINETITYSQLKQIKPDDCEEAVINIKKQSHLLKYNGRKYLIQKKYKGNGF